MSFPSPLEFIDGLKIVLWKYIIVLKAIVFSEVKIKNFFFFFIFGRAGSSLLCGFFSCSYSGGYSLVSEHRLLLLQSTSSGIPGVQ